MEGDRRMEESGAIKRTVRLFAGKRRIKIILKLVKVCAPVILGITAFFGIVLLIVFATVPDVDMSGITGNISGSVTEEAKQLIPREYLKVYYAAEKEYGVPWNLLAAIHYIETSFGKNIPVLVERTGHMQMLKKVWVGQSYPYAVVLPEDLINPAVILKYGGYGMDVDGDGRADPDNVTDAVYSLAKYLADNGAASGQYTKALYAYSGSDNYVEHAVDVAKSYVTELGSETDYGDYEARGKIVNTAKLKIGHTVYVFGGGRTETEAKKGIYDCSSFVWWVFKENGVTLGNLTDVNTETLNKLGKRIPLEDARPGDLVFWDTYKTDGHVAIYIGNNKCIGCQNETGAAIIDMQDLYWQSVFKGHVRRLFAE